MTELSQAVFISHASQDAEAAAKICAALRAAAIEVWFDQSELRGGDAWDQRIRREIRECALFVPVISANTASREEGYFRLEWDLADQRTHMLARNRTFIVPVCLDATPDAGADVPESFQRVHWIRLSAGEIPAEFITRVKRLLHQESLTPSLRQSPEPIAATVPAEPAVARRRRRFIWVLGGVGLLCAGVYLVGERPWSPRRPPAPQLATSTVGGRATVNGVTEKSIAVLPFADLSEKKDQEYFADGLAEELLDLLAKTPGLHVIARTSSFSFKGKSDDIPTIAAKLKVANVLEGSVRTSGHRLRVSTQLVRAADGEHLWSETYDRELKDVFKVQDEIAAAVVAALKLKLSPAQTSAASRSINTDAYFQYLLGQQSFNHGGVDGFRSSVTAYRRAIALDPRYGAAYAGLALSEYYLADAVGDTVGLQRASAAADRAVELAPDGALGYVARGYMRGNIAWDWAGAQADLAKALDLDPGDPIALRQYSILLQSLGRVTESIAVARRVTDFDPFSAPAWRTLCDALLTSGDLSGAREAARRSLAIDPTDPLALADLGTTELLDRRPADALVAYQSVSDAAFRLTGVAMAEHSLGHESESLRALDEAIAKYAQDSAYQITQVYSWRGEKEKAFEWLERAYQQRDGGLPQGLKTDRLLISLREDPRYKATLRKINLPE